MRISLVIPTWNAGPLLEEVLGAVNALEGVVFHEKVAVDSGSTDGTLERLRGGGFEVFGMAERAHGLHAHTSDPACCGGRAAARRRCVQPASRLIRLLVWG